MNMDYSKAFELLNQDAEKEHNEKAEKAVHDNLYNKGFRDGLAVLDKIRAEIEEHCGLIKENHCRYCSYCNSVMGVREILEILDKYKVEETEAHLINENIAKGFEEFTKMMFKQGQAERGEE